MPRFACKINIYVPYVVNTSALYPYRKMVKIYTASLRKTLSYRIYTFHAHPPFNKGKRSLYYSRKSRQYKYQSMCSVIPPSLNNRESSNPSPLPPHPHPGMSKYLFSHHYEYHVYSPAKFPDTLPQRISLQLLPWHTSPEYQPPATSLTHFPRGTASSYFPDTLPQSISLQLLPWHTSPEDQPPATSLTHFPRGSASSYFPVALLLCSDLRWKQAFSPILTSLRTIPHPSRTVIGWYHARSNVLDLLFCLFSTYGAPQFSIFLTTVLCHFKLYSMVMENIRLLLLLLLLSLRSSHQFVSWHTFPEDLPPASSLTHFPRGSASS